MKQSPDLENFLKTSIQKNVTIERKQQNQTIWHWLLLILFGLLTFDTAVTPNWLVYTYCRYC